MDSIISQIQVGGGRERGRGRTNLIRTLIISRKSVLCVNRDRYISSTRKRMMEEQSAKEEEEMRVCNCVDRGINIYKYSPLCYYYTRLKVKGEKM